MPREAGGRALRLLVLAPYPAVRAGLRALLAATADVVVAGEGAWPPVREAGVEPVDLVLADIGEDAEGVEETLEEFVPGLPAVLLGSWGETAELVRAGAARGYLARDASAEEIAAAVRAVAAGLTVFDPAVAAGLLHPHPDGSTPATESTLTDREREVLTLVALGLPNKGIALRLGISEHTAKFHVGTILSKLGAASRTEAVMLAARRGLLPL